MLTALDDARARGYAFSDQENIQGLLVLAAPVLDQDGKPIAGLSVATPDLAETAAMFEAGARDR